MDLGDRGMDADMTMHSLLRQDDAGKIIILFLSFFLTSPQPFFLPDALVTEPHSAIVSASSSGIIF